MLIIIPNAFQVHALLDPVLDCLQCACVLRQHDAFPPLQQAIVFQQAENMMGE